MTYLDVLTAKIEAGYRLQKDPERRPILRSALELVDAARHAGAGVTLNPVQTAALAQYLEYHEAQRELRMRKAEESRGGGSPVPTGAPGAVPDNVILFPNPLRRGEGAGQ